jgi:hypothetical protein
VATPRRPYSTIRNGEFEEALAAGVSTDGTLLFARLRTHPLKRSIPGLLHLGPAGLSESLNLKLSLTQRWLSELEGHGLAIVDRRERLIYCVGAIDIDGPRTENSLRGMAMQFRELPPRSLVTRAVRTAIEATLSTGEKTKAAEWQSIWTEIIGPEPSPEPGLESGPESGPLPRSASAAAAAADPAFAEQRAPGHVKHAACDPTRSRCVPTAVHAKLSDLLAPRHGGDRQAAGSALKTWYREVWATLPADHVMGDAFAFWQARFDGVYASKHPVAANRQPKSMVPSVERTAEYLRRQRHG